MEKGCKNHRKGKIVYVVGKSWNPSELLNLTLLVTYKPPQKVVDIDQGSLFRTQV